MAKDFIRNNLFLALNKLFLAHLTLEWITKYATSCDWRQMQWKIDAANVVLKVKACWNLKVGRQGMLC